MSAPIGGEDVTSANGHSYCLLPGGASFLFNPLNSSGEVYLQVTGTNPAQHSVTLRWELPEAAHVRVVVRDVTGRRLHTLLDERIPAGPQLALHPSPQMQSGLHFVQVLVNGALQYTAKLLIL